MLEIKVTLEIPGLPDSLNNLAEAVRGKSSATTAQIPTQTVTQPEAAPTANPTPAVVTPTASSAPTANTPPASPANVPPVTVAQSSPAPTSSPSDIKAYTLAELSNAGAALCEQGKMPQLIQLLAQFGAQSIVQVGKEHYPTLADGLKALGANL